MDAAYRLGNICYLPIGGFVDRPQLLESLAKLAVPDEIARCVPAMPIDASGLFLYGSRARGDAVSGSDLDLLAIVDQPRPSTYSGQVSVSYYTIAHVESGRGTLFGAHLKRDAKVLWDPTGELGAVLSRMGEVDTRRLFSRARNMSKILGSLEMDLPKYLTGLLREARYLLRSCLYACAIAEGSPCFSVREIAKRNADPQLASLLASRQQTTEPSVDDLSECISRLEAILGPLPTNPHGSLEALVVNEWQNGGDLLSMGFMALGATGGDSDYAEVEKILL
jgi:Nucleotidyltransferase domain